MIGAAEKKKPSLAVLIGMGKPKAGGDEEDMADKGDDESSEEGSSLDAAQAVIDAVKAGDAGALDDALKLHYDLCADE